ncbi:alpha-galactosidase [Paenibacillus lemnae]|uniref:Alpha-galactosidase n=1 Tax=Paenibacillus lemnae TaxID=1330551 RepID=A0A848M839_PAELE|nr:alpha-galactosidase [Paenibacillus lemnae]NMO96429.1 alpha-galactosidase [Paenibacillus lemnae]
MMIHISENEKLFYLGNDHFGYAMEVVKEGYLAHVYWGKSVRPSSLHRVLQYRGRSAVSPRPVPEDPSFSPDTLPQEYPAYGAGDFRNPAFQIRQPDGSTVTALKYRAYRITQGKPELQGLPAVYAEAEDGAQTLEIELLDELIGLRVFLSYTVIPAFNALFRSVRYENGGELELVLQRALSMSVDMPHAEYELLHLSGAHLRERHMHQRRLEPGALVLESRRGASGHQHNPFAALLAPGSTEDAGEVFGFSLVYSGSFAIQAEVDQFLTTRLSMGINPLGFGWQLQPGESFQTPEVVMVYSDQGLGGMSQTYHRLYRDRLCRGVYRDRERPVLINNWEATYFDFNEEKLLTIAKAGAELGMELFVLDDGWFGTRDHDRSSLGDWTVHRDKLPYGLKGLAEQVESFGMSFGLWFEPEMVSPDSELYRSHPDWCLHVPQRKRTESRHQLVLDLSRSDVCDYIVESVSDILASAPISYVKWDFNRNLTEIGSALLPPERQAETAHRYMLGLYDVLERITQRFPDVLFESCAGGGGRFDPGMLFYMPQVWTSDNSDAISRLYIQYGTSMVYPAVTMGAHVSAVPNHQVGRNTPLDIRGHAAMSGNFGYELDLTTLSSAEKEEVREQIMLYKELRPLIQFGDFYRLMSPFEHREAAWMFVSRDKQEAAVFYFQIEADTAGPLRKLRLKGLDPMKDYAAIGSEDEVYGGDHLMGIGVSLPYLHGDYRSILFRFRQAGG